MSKYFGPTAVATKKLKTRHPQIYWEPFATKRSSCPPPTLSTVDKSEYMVGSYGPRPNEAYQYLTAVEEAPKGMMARGNYTVKSKFTDDDKNDHLSWEWSLAIKKDWKD